MRKLLLTICILFVYFITKGVYADSSYIDNKNGTVTDKKTKLIWQKCSIGQENEIECLGEAKSHNWIHAMRACKNLKLAGKKWRLPTSEEIQTLLDIDYDFGIDTKVFPLPIENGGLFWTSTSNSPETSKGFGMNFRDGGIFITFKDYSYYVRCVASP